VHRFVLFPGVDSTRQVEELGATMGFTPLNGKLVNLSMGQGQEGPAEAAIARLADTGRWVGAPELEPHADLAPHQ
jgi:dynein heavy chain